MHYLMCIIHFMYSMLLILKRWYLASPVCSYLSLREKKVIELGGANKLMSGWPHLLIQFHRISSDSFSKARLLTSPTASWMKEPLSNMCSVLQEILSSLLPGGSESTSSSWGNITLIVLLKLFFLQLQLSC